MWQVDIAVNTMKALLPFQEHMRDLKRRLQPPAIGPQHASVIAGGIDHVSALREVGLDLKGKDILEIGSGWFPIIPLMLRVAGARRIYLTDVHVLMDSATLTAAIDYVLAERERIAASLNIPPSAFEVVDADRPGDFDLMLDQLNFVYKAPFDTAEDMPEVDAVVSQTVFEHISPDLLDAILTDVKKGLKPGGLMSHGIDNTDHRANHDPSLGRFDFLKYSDGVWRLLCLNPQDYTNRLRHSDYLELFEKTGHKVVLERKHVSEKQVEQLAEHGVHPSFRDKDPQDLVTGWTHLVSRLERAVG